MAKSISGKNVSIGTVSWSPTRSRIQRWALAEQDEARLAGGLVVEDELLDDAYVGGGGGERTGLRVRVGEPRVVVDVAVRILGEVRILPGAFVGAGLPALWTGLDRRAGE